VFSTDRVLLSDLIAGFCRKEESREAVERRYKVMSHVMMRWGTRSAGAVYAMQAESTEFLHHAKAKGVKIILDICVNPLAHRIAQNERMQFPGWEDPVSDAELEALESGMRDNLMLADLVICPSNVVARGVREFVNDLRGRLAVVPYGSSFSKEENEGRPGRILYAGEANMRKGIYYLASAARLLNVDTPGQYECRVAGAVSRQICRRAECDSLNFLGKLSRSELMEEYACADVFVLPTLAEGLPAVLLEAVSFGVPVITTEASGLEVEDGENGILIPERDDEALADAIRRVVTDRELRARLASGARKLAKEYSIEIAGRRLIQAVSTIEDLEE
jgi:glycosyltransferase involved in cell wall biosynthesis